MRKHIKKYFIPHEENDHKPHIFHEASVLVLAVLILGSFTLTAYEANLVKNDTGFLAAVLPSVLVTLANDDRTDRGVEPLVYSEVLEHAAQMKANDMAEHSYFAHTSPKGVTPWYWFEKVGYDFKYAGENLAVDFEESEDVDDAWMASPHHRRNILETRFTQIGIATARGMHDGEEAVYVVQLFGTPANLSASSDSVPPENTEREVKAREDLLAVNTVENRNTNKPNTPEVQPPEADASVAGEFTDAVLSGDTHVPQEKPRKKDVEEKDEASSTESTTTPLAFAPISPDSVKQPPETEEVGAGEAVSSNDSSVAIGAGSGVTSETTFFAWLFLHQMLLLQILYLFFGALVALSLGLMVRNEFHHQHVRHATAGMSLLVLMVVLTTLGHFYIFPILSFT